MVWTQASGWDGTEWASIDIMKASYSEDPKQLQPVKLRAAPGGIGSCLAWHVGGGYAVTFERASKQMEDVKAYVFLVRLSDGTMWQVPSRPERSFAPLYVTSEEVVLEEALTLPNDAGVTDLESWSIVRYPISLLGPGLPP